MVRTCSLIAGIFVLWSVNILSAQESNLTSPQPEHELLQRFAGEWRFEQQKVISKRFRL